MPNIVILIISLSLSILLFNFVFDKLNYKYKSFEHIQNKINNLDEKKKDKLTFIFYASISILYGIMATHSIDYILRGLICGLLASLIAICLKNIPNK